MSDDIADVVHITKDTFDKFQRLGAEEEFRAMAQAEVSILLRFGEGVVVFDGWDIDPISANGATLAEAIFRLMKNPSVELSTELRETTIKRFQQECLHDGECYFEGHGSIKKCSICHITLEKA